MQAHIDYLGQALKPAADDLDRAVRNSPWWDRSQLLRGAPGVGPVLSTALAGVAPFNQERGALHGQRSIQGGGHRLRRVWFGATVAATRCTPVLKPCFQRLRAAAKVALVAIMRGLLLIHNAMFKHQIPWRPPCPAV